MKYIPLIYTNLRAIVDDNIYEALLIRNYSFNKKNGYAYGWDSVGKVPIPLHYWILKPQPGLECDHLDRNKLNNQVDNLRLVPHHVNQLNRIAPRGEDNKNIYEKDFGYQVAFKRKGIYIFIGTFNNKQEARVARDEWLFKQGIFA